jgi:hypothetical protein
MKKILILLLMLPFVAFSQMKTFNVIKVSGDTIFGITDTLVISNISNGPYLPLSGDTMTGNIWMDYSKLYTNPTSYIYSLDYKSMSFIHAGSFPSSVVFGSRGTVQIKDSVSDYGINLFPLSSRVNVKNTADGFLQFPTMSTNKIWTLPDTSGTIALNSQLDNYLLNTSDTLDGFLSITDSLILSGISVDSIVGTESITGNIGNSTTPVDTVFSTMLRQSNTYHIIGSFENESEVIDLTQNVYSQVTNATTDLWTGVELDGFTVTNDKITVLNEAHYFGNYVFTFTGTSGTVFKFRLWNETKGIVIAPSVSMTGDGGSDYVSITIPFYSDEIDAGDVIYTQVTNINSSVDITMIDGFFMMMYLHD